MIVTHKINMNLDKAGAMPRVDAVQGDANTREIQFTLYSEGQPWAIPADAQVLVRFSKPDGTGGTYDTLPDGTAASVVSGNTVTVTLAPQVLTAAGAATLAVTLVQGTQELTTFSVLVNIIKNPTAAVSANGDYVSVAGMIPVASGASAGQYLAVTSVDADGTVTGLKAVSPLNGEQPIVVLSAEEMEDTDKIYLYMGTEDGWQYGAWYYHNGSTWVVGNAYGIGEKGEPGADAPVDTYLPKSGGTMSGPIAMGGSRITDLAAPAEDTDAVNKAYVDGKPYWPAATADLPACGQYAYLKWRLYRGSGNRGLHAIMTVNYTLTPEGAAGPYHVSETYLITGLSCYSYGVTKLASNVTNLTGMDMTDAARYTYQLSYETHTDGSLDITIKNFNSLTADIGSAILPIVGSAIRT